jgi:hypothetical protein
VIANKDRTLERLSGENYAGEVAPSMWTAKTRVNDVELTKENTFVLGDRTKKIFMRTGQVLLVGDWTDLYTEVKAAAPVASAAPVESAERPYPNPWKFAIYIPKSYPAN